MSPALSTDRPARFRRRLSAFEWVQLLLVLWVALLQAARVQAGVEFLPQLPSGPSPARPGWIGVLLGVLNAGSYPALAFLVSRRAPLWEPTRGGIARYAAVLAALHGAAWLSSLLEPRLGFGWMFYLHRSFEFVVYAVFAHGMLYGERFHQQEGDALRLRAAMAGAMAERARAQVRALRMEWSPRFLTGTLESIGELLARDVPRAKRMLLGLSAVLRRILAHARLGTVRLEQEMELAREVARVEELRRPGLTVEWDVDPRTLDAAVPHLSLVAMVCEAVRHGAEDGDLRVRILAAVDGAEVRLRVDAIGTLGGPPVDEAAHADDADRVHAYRRMHTPGALSLELACRADAEEDAAALPADDVPPPAARPAATSSPTSPPTGHEARPPAAEPARPGEVPLAGRRLENATFAAFLCVGTLFTLFSAHARVASGDVLLKAPTWMYVVGSGVYAVLWWGSLIAAARALSARFPIRQSRWASRLAIHALGAVVVSVLNAVAYWPFEWNMVQGGAVAIGLRSYWEWGDLRVYLPLAGIAHGFIYAREYHARRLAELRLRSELAETELERTRAELQALKAELDPHFLFNALNTVSSLMHARVDEARRVVAHLSALLRKVLESTGLQEVTVEEEVEFIRLYVEIEQARFGDALRMEYDLHPHALDARVPHLLVQPLVENAIKHGLRPRDGTGTVTLAARRVDDWLELAVRDDGVGLAPETPSEGAGTGLANVRRRLRQLYRDQHAFGVEPAAGGGTRAVIRIPFSRQPSSAATPAPALQPA